MLTFDERVNFYLGYDLINLYPLTIETLNLSETYEIICNDDDYGAPFKNLLNKTNNLNKKFKVCFGDIDTTQNLITLCKNRCYGNSNSVILRCLNYPRHWQNFYNRPQDIDFDNKISKVFWRGSTTGKPENKCSRFEMVTNWFNRNNDIDVGFNNICQGRTNYAKYVKEECNISEFLKYKYILSVEGNDKDSGINWKLNSNSLVFMTKPRICSWLMETTLIPDYHYVMLKDDFSDLEEKMNWCNNNPDICKTIIKNANIFMSQFKDDKNEEKIEESVINKYFDITKSL